MSDFKMFLTIAVLAFALLASTESKPPNAKFEYGCSNNENRDNLRDTFLDFHNDKRRRVADGEQRTVDGKKLNPAKNMYELPKKIVLDSKYAQQQLLYKFRKYSNKWNCEMEQIAQEHIKMCNGSMDGFGSWSANSMRYQIQIQGDDNPFKHPKMMIKGALDSWWNAVRNVTLGDGNKYTNETLYYFANMVNAATTEIGCAFKVCGDLMQIFCLYDDIGHINGMTLYETGNGCQSSKDCRTYRGSTCYNKLCKKPLEKNDNGKSDICKEGNNMTDKIRNTILERHNYFRSLVARGKAEDKRGGHTPVASSMLKLKYDCDLEKLAVTHAQKCVYEHSDNITRKGTGENVYTVSIPNASKLKAVEWASRSWFSELKQFGVGKGNMYTWKLLNDTARAGGKIGHYAQMVWGSTEYVGCGVHNCGNQTLVVCNYNATGNYIDRIIYEKGGKLCSKCPAGYECKEGLCVRKEDLILDLKKPN